MIGMRIGLERLRPPTGLTYHHPQHILDNWEEWRWLGLFIDFSNWHQRSLDQNRCRATSRLTVLLVGVPQDGCPRIRDGNGCLGRRSRERHRVVRVGRALILELVVHGERFLPSATTDQPRTSSAVTQLVGHTVDQRALLKVLFLEN